MSIQIRVEGAKVAFPKWAFRPMAATWRSRVAPVVLDALKSEAPEYKYDDTVLSRGQVKGDLKKSIRLDSVGGGIGKGVSMVFTSDVPYAKYVISGTRGHEIPKGGEGSGKILHWERGGTHYYRRSVQHPGTTANDFPRRAIDRVQPFIRRTLTLTVSEYIKPEQL